MATKQELENRVAELESANECLLLDLEWERLSGQKLMAAIAQASKAKAKKKRGTLQVEKQGEAKGNGTKTLSAGPIPVDIFGNRMGTQGGAE